VNREHATRDKPAGRGQQDGASHGRLCRFPAPGPVGLCALVLLPVVRGLSRNSYTGVALVLAALAPAGTLVFTRFVGGEDQPTPPTA